MRDIKFRAWHKVNKEWHEGFSILPDGRIWSQDDCECQNVILMQYTGLKDENDVEIYEGDIIDSPNFPRRPVEWNQEAVRFEPLHIWRSTNFKIIGNIQENPELLK